MDDIFKYLDYRDYLRDHYRYNKSYHRYFSFRYVAGKTGLDASFYVKVLNKQKHIANSSIPTLISFLKLSPHEGKYFTTLVHFNKAKTAEQESFYLQKLFLLRKPVTTQLESHLYEYLAAWWNVALREEMNIINFKDDYNDLASRFHPPLSIQQIIRGVRLLLKLGLIAPDETGVLRPVNDFLTTNGVDQVKLVRSFQKSVIKLALNAIDTIDKGDREISTLTVSVSRKAFETIRERISDLRREIIELVRRDANPEEVYQLNIQLFPLTKNSKKNESL